MFNMKLALLLLLHKFDYLFQGLEATNHWRTKNLMDNGTNDYFDERIIMPSPSTSHGSSVKEVDDYNAESLPAERRSLSNYLFRYITKNQNFSKPISTDNTDNSEELGASSLPEVTGKTTLILFRNKCHY